MIVTRFVLALVALVGFSAAALGAESTAPAASPFVGSWVLNVAKSSYVPGPAPKSGTRTTVDLGGGKLKTTIDTVAANNTTTHTEAASYALDGKDYAVTGNPTFDMVSVKQVDANTVEVTGKLAGKVTASYKVQVSADGKTLTQTTPGATPDAKPTIAIYDKQ